MKLANGLVSDVGEHHFTSLIILPSMSYNGVGDTFIWDIPSLFRGAW